MIQFGLRLHDAEKLPMEQLLPLVRKRGFTCAHLALSKTVKDVPCTPSALTPGYALYLRHLFEQNGIDIAVLGNYLNLAYPDETVLDAIREKYYATSALPACWAAVWWARRRAVQTSSINTARSAAPMPRWQPLSRPSSPLCAAQSSTA